MTGRMRKQGPAPKRPGISKKPPRTPKLNPDVMEKAFGNDGWTRTFKFSSSGQRYELIAPPTCAAPTLRERWVKFVNGIGGRLLRYGR